MSPGLFEAQHRNYLELFKFLAESRNLIEITTVTGKKKKENYWVLTKK